MAAIASSMLALHGAGASSAFADLILTSEVPGSSEPKIQGDLKEIAKTYSPASTFKIIITFAAVENEVANAYTVLKAPDREKLAGKTDLNGREAMFFSSNEYYLHLMERLSPQTVVDMAKRCGFGNAVGDDAAPMKANAKDWGHGGRIIYISPAQQHTFMREFAAARLPLKPHTMEETLKTMEWPGRAGYKVYAKSGSFDKIFWFTGMAVKEGAPTRVITVLVTAKDGTRDQAIQRFYEQLGPPAAGEPAIPQKPDPLPPAPQQSAPAEKKQPAVPTGS